MLNTPFKWSERKVEKTKLWAQIFAVLVQSGKPLLQVIIWMNENFEDIYMTSENETEVYEMIFDVWEIHYERRD